jgi:hypothetical protein
LAAEPAAGLADENAAAVNGDPPIETPIEAAVETASDGNSPAARIFAESSTADSASPAGAPPLDPVGGEEVPIESEDVGSDAMASEAAASDAVASEAAAYDATASDVEDAGAVAANAMESDAMDTGAAGPAIVESLPADMTTAEGPVSDADAREVSAGTRVIQSRNVESPRFRAPFNDLRGTVSSPALPLETPSAPALPTAPLGPPRSLPTDSVNARDMAAGSAAPSPLAVRAAAPTALPPTALPPTALPPTTAAFPAAAPIASTRATTGAGSRDSSLTTNRGMRGLESAGPIARGLPTGNISLISRVSYESDRPSATADLLVRHALTPPEDLNWQIPGQAWPLYSVLERQGEPGTERSSRLAVVRAYWRLTTDVAAYNWAVEEGAFVAGLQVLQPETETLALEAARTAAQSRLQQARVAATGTQCELADIAGQSLREPLPLPSELPLVGPYQTRFETLFANRAPPAGIRRIATTIPLRAELLQTLAATVAADTDAIKELAVFHREGRVPLEPVLAAHDRLQRHRAEFLEAVRVYNDQIAEYALAIAGTSNNQTVVAMLVRNPTIIRAAQAPRVPGMSTAVPANGYSPAPATGSSAAGSSGFPNANAAFPTNAATGGPTGTAGFAPQGYRPTATATQGSASSGYGNQAYGNQGAVNGGTAIPPNSTSPRTSSRGATWLSPAK